MNVDQSKQLQAFSNRLTNIEPPTPDNAKAAKNTLLFAGRMVAVNALTPSLLVCHFAGAVGATIGGAVGVAGGLIQGLFCKAARVGDKSLSDYVINGLNTGVKIGESAGQKMSLPIMPATLATGGIIGGTFALLASPFHFSYERNRSLEEQYEKIEQQYFDNLKQIACQSQEKSETNETDVHKANRVGSPYGPSGARGLGKVVISHLRPASSRNWYN